MAASAVAWFLATGVPAHAADEKKPATDETLPQWAEVQSVIKDSMGKRSKAEILSHGDASKTFAKLEKAGWNLADRKQIEKRFLSDSDFLVRQLRSKAGRKFMQRIETMSGAYDHLDHLRKMPYGPRRIRELIRGPDGYKLIEYMTSTKGCKNLGRQFSRGVNGKGFNKPTGRLYTARQFTAELQRLHKAALAKSQPKSGRTPREKRRTPREKR
jgi:hypothetical protein